MFPRMEVFDAGVVDVYDIDDNGNFYGDYCSLQVLKCTCAE